MIHRNHIFKLWVPHSLSLHTQISTLTGRVGTHHTTTEDPHKERHNVIQLTTTHNYDGSRRLITCSKHMPKFRTLAGF